jgi:adenine deaminase
VNNGVVRPHLEDDTLIFAMADRFQKGPDRIGLGFVRGLPPQGRCDRIIGQLGMRKPGCRGHQPRGYRGRIQSPGGGRRGEVIVRDGEVLGLVEMALLGLLSEDPTEVVIAKFERPFAGRTIREP